MTHPRPRDEALLALLRDSSGSTEDRVARALDLLAEQLDMDAAFVSRFRDGTRFVTHAGGGRDPEDVAVPMPLLETLCHLVASGSIAPLVPDAGQDPLLAAHPLREPLRLGAHVGIPLTAGGEVVGAVCALAHTPRPGLRTRDVSRLSSIATFIGEVLEAGDGQRPGDGAGGGHAGEAAGAVDGLKDRAAARRWLTAVSSGLRPDVEQLAVAKVTTIGGTGLGAVHAAVQDVVRQGDLRARTAPDTLLLASVVPPGEAHARGWEERLAAALGARPGTTARLEVSVLPGDASGSAVDALLGDPGPAAVPAPRAAEPPVAAPPPPAAHELAEPYDGPVTLDPVVVEELRALGDEDFAQIYGDFGRDLPRSVEELLSAAYRTRRPDAVARLAHRLKGGASSVGALRLAALCGEVEERATGTDVPLTDLMSTLAVISGEAADVSTEIAALLRPAGTAG